MEGKKLFFVTKSCNSPVHKLLVEKIETNILTLFDVHALNNRIIPKCSSLLEATHFQYIDINGTIHIRPMREGGLISSDVVNFRLLTSPHRFFRYQSLETPLEPLLDLYQEHLVKPSLEVRYDRKI